MRGDVTATTLIRTLAFGANTPTMVLGQNKANIEVQCLRTPPSRMMKPHQARTQHNPVASRVSNG